MLAQPRDWHCIFTTCNTVNELVIPGRNDRAVITLLHMRGEGHMWVTPYILNSIRNSFTNLRSIFFYSPLESRSNLKMPIYKITYSNMNKYIQFFAQISSTCYLVNHRLQLRESFWIKSADYVLKSIEHVKVITSITTIIFKHKNCVNHNFVLIAYLMILYIT